MTVQYSIDRYSTEKKFISTGLLVVIRDYQTIILRYDDQYINVEVNAFYHPIQALENLRAILWTKHASVIACNGCRVDASYRGSGSYQSYLLSKGKQATQRVNMFAPTKEIEKLCSIEEHKVAYRQWCDSL